MTKLKRFSTVFILLLAFSTFFSSFAFADDDKSSSLVALGDSITFGFNLEQNQTQASPNAFPNLIGPKGAYKVTNLAVPGLTSTQLLNSIHPVGNAGKALKQADVITLYIGGNDLLQATGLTKENLAILNSLPADQKLIRLNQLAAQAPAALGGVVNTLSANLPAIIKEIRSQNKHARIILYNLYNPIGDANDPLIHQLHSLGDNLISTVNAQVINPIATQSKNVYLANAFAAFDGNQSQYIIPGDVHPTLAGHKALAKLATNILSALHPEKEHFGHLNWGKTKDDHRHSMKGHSFEK